jgi:hypothetical protein
VLYEAVREILATLLARRTPGETRQSPSSALCIIRPLSRALIPLQLSIGLGNLPIWWLIRLHLQPKNIDEYGGAHASNRSGPP